VPSTTRDAADAAQLKGEVDTGGRFRRQGNAFTHRITADGASGFPAEPGRYHLYVSLACPWAHRQIIVRELKGLTEVVSMSVVNPWRDERGWNFLEGFDDPVAGRTYLSEAYRATDPEYDRRVTVPAIWDRASEQVVTNDYRVIDVQLNDEFDAHAGRPEVDLHPAELHDQIAAIDERLFHGLNNGVYRAGFATTQAAYEEAYQEVFSTLDWLEEHLADRRYLVGDRLTLADIRAFTTLVRFDAVYQHHFRCNRNALREMPVVWAYARDLFQTPGFGDTVDWDHIKRHYYTTHETLNPLAIVPAGPDVDWTAPHGRDALGPGFSA
jgi:putative glutathione S-transferase